MDWMTQRVISNWKALADIAYPTNPVTIDYDRLNEVMAEHTSRALATASHLPYIPGVNSEDPEIAVSYIIAGNIWNFGFKTPGQPTYRVASPENPDKPFEGFMAFWHAIYRNFGERVITADLLRPHVDSVEAMAEFFRGLTDIPLPELRQRCGIDFVSMLNRQYGDSPLALFPSVFLRGQCRAFNDGQGIVEILVNNFKVAYGSDQRTLYRHSFPFFKRARLAAMQLHQYSVSSGGKIYPLIDVNDLGPIIDYQMPRILRALGVLVYTPGLDKAIERGDEIQLGSLWEIALRASATVALAHWAESMQIPMWRLDPYLFSISRGLSNKAHYTKSSDY